MKHFKTGDAGQSKQNSEEPSGFKGHPECGFCKDGEQEAMVAGDETEMFGLIALVLILVFVIVHLAGGGLGHHTS